MKSAVFENKGKVSLEFKIVVMLLSALFVHVFVALIYGLILGWIVKKRIPLIVAMKH